ncbi:MAG TPA: ATP-dependent DNA ligase, partial [Thermoanaerobaculia bacterium]|nr:ATP-dependent DNA ligase [Thermoanaerobaculia bacterium]
MLSVFTAVAREIAATTKRNEKERLLAAYLSGLDDASLERAAVFFTGAPFPGRDERVTGVGWSIVAEAASEATGASKDALGEQTLSEGDLGDGLVRFFPEEAERDVSLVELGEIFDDLAATTGTLDKIATLAGLFRRLDREGARFVTKILLNEFRIGLQIGLVESAVAKAFGRPVGEVRRAQMFVGDIGTTALLARSGTLGEASIRLFHPLGFMLAQPEEDPGKIVDLLGSEALADDKYDGIRAQIHFDGTEVRIYSRTLDEISGRFPEIVTASAELSAPCILDGELVAFRDGILPFAVIQKRLGRKSPSARLLEEAPVVFFAFDVLSAGDEAVLELPLQMRLSRLRELLTSTSRIRPSTQSQIRDASHIDELFDQARARGNEGLVIKGADSLYTPGRRGKAWLKYKKALATLDCVITAAQYGHGKRRNVLSDYTFAVRADDQLLNIGKAYSGLTDTEIDQLTSRLTELTISRHGPVHVVRPEIVLEIAFDRIQESARHKSGYALRFPRIANLRDDKSPEEISTLDEVRRIYEGQLRRE